ncbi:hypothetical protein AB674_08890 [Flavobacterium sp. ABG]|jgi:hypothetical protein|nr:hypothetical protein AB674_08890 [Flavobacterium sp. ABG]
MELTFTFFIEFTFGVFIILALLFIYRIKIKMSSILNFDWIVNFFQRFSRYVNFVFSNPSQRFVN